MCLRLAALLAIFLANHAQCVGMWDIATCVPSAHRVALEPAVSRVQLLAGRYGQVLTAQPDGSDRTVDPAQFTVTSDVNGLQVRLFDDTFTTGAKLFGAVAALRERGAVVVGPVVIGRHIQRSCGPSAELLSWVKERSWAEDRCAG